MNWFVVIALTIILALHILIFRRLTAAPSLPSRARWAIGITMGVLVVLFISAQGSLWAPVLSPGAARPLAWVGMSWLAFGLYLALALIVVAIVAGVLITLRGREASRPPRRLVNRVGAVTAVVVAAATTTWGIVSAGDPAISAYTVQSDDLPEEFDGLRVAVVSDLHIGAVRSADFLADVVAQTNAEDPDIVVLAGDLIEGAPDRYAGQLDPLDDLDAPLGVYAVTGNHEFISGEPGAWMTSWETHDGVTVLRNESVTVDKDGASIHIAGVQDATGEAPFAPDPDKALSQTDPDEFILYVAHQPKQAEDVQGRGIDLQVSGHTHGGQLWPMQGLVLLDQPMLDGSELVGDVPVVTSRGAGTWGPPVRVGAPPEIPIITLTR